MVTLGLAFPHGSKAFSPLTPTQWPLPISLCGPWQPPVGCPSLWTYLFWVFQMNGVTSYAAFYVWLLLLGSVFSIFNHYFLSYLLRKDERESTFECRGIKGQLPGICPLLLSCGSWGPNSHCQALWQAPLPGKSSCQSGSPLSWTFIGTSFLL